MGRLTKHRTTHAVLWSKNGIDTDAKPTVAAGVEVRVRWEEKVTETLDETNQTVRTEVRIVADRYIPVGSILWKGRLRDLPSPVTDVTDLFQVVVKGDIPNVKGIENRYTALLIRYGDTLPTIS